MVKTRKKGNRRELQTEKIYQSWGYKTHRAGNQRFKHNDIFGIADILAINGESLEFIQVKSNKCDNKTRNELKELINQLNNPNITGSIWIIKDRKEIIVEVYGFCNFKVIYTYDKITNYLTEKLFEEKTNAGTKSN